jgi:hypothetical protein
VFITAFFATFIAAEAVRHGPATGGDERRDDDPMNVVTRLRGEPDRFTQRGGSMFRQMLALAAVVLVGAATLLTAPSPASAEPTVAADRPVATGAPAFVFTNTVIQSTQMRSCPWVGVGCALAGQTVVGQHVKDFCSRPDGHGSASRWNLIVHPAGASMNTRAGFVPESTLLRRQNTDCVNGGAGAFVFSGATAVPRVCPSTSCAVAGQTLTPSDGGLRQYCSVNGQTVAGSPVWYLIYNPRTDRAGFAPSSQVGGVPNPGSCL